MLSAPGLRFCMALPPFHQLDVGPAYPAVGGVLGCTRFLVVFLVFYILLFIFHYVYLYSTCPCIRWVPWGFLCRGDA